MSNELKVIATDTSDLESAAAAAAQLAEEAKTADDIGRYTHVLKKPFTYGGRTYEALTFDWEALTGADSLAIEGEMLLHGKTLVTPAFSGEYLTGMAARACTERSESGGRVVGTDAIKALALTDFSKICGKARTFLLRSGS